MELPYIEILKGCDVLGIVASVHQGKTNTLIQFIEEVDKYEGNKVAYFYHSEYKERLRDKVAFVSTLEELEQVQNSVIFIDEFKELFHLNDRHAVELVRQVFAMMKHNNNKIVLCGVPDYYNKFVSGQVDEWVCMSLAYNELINGSGLKKYINSLSGEFVGGTRLYIKVGQALYKGMLYDVRYNKETDKKADAVEFFTTRKEETKVISKRGVKKL